MNGFDYALLAVVGLSAVLGFWRGLLSEVVALGAWVLAFVMAKSFTAELKPFTTVLVKEPLLQGPAAFLIIFVAVLVFVAILRWALSELIRAAGLGVVDRFLGACFGAVRGGLIVFALALLVGIGGFAREAWWREASLSAPLEAAVTASRPWLPEPLAKRLRYR
ncbi:MAG TPA: CvpA family protein [Zoogloea sp.]|uniref:CvpA family protein n=1 Tax=Zoogloea sp. TaxID=49181 RepID=UPI002C1293D1|nr:CvpA family protein [Zoogloea sp.]HOB46726.1 CvpA family protein [Zoogloea sp.]HQA08873.1 CvpA family protein [Zoogloea sp.]HQE39100.1 CvpA family protein [Zoogloea sp.]